MNGSPEPENDGEQRCDHCGLYFSSRGIDTHERTCDWAEFDTLHPEAEALDEPSDEGTDPETGATGDPPEGTGATQDPDYVAQVDPDDEGRTAKTDGGPQSPPTAEQPEPSVDDLPERYIPIEEYVAAVREEAGERVDIDALRDRLKPYDVVDVEETTSERIAAHRLSEVAA